MSNANTEGIAFFSEQDPSADVGQSVQLSGSSCPTCKSCSNNTLPSDQSSSSQGVPSQVAEEHADLFTAFLSSYESFVAGRTSSLELINEDYDQIHPGDLDEMDIQWNS